jgi:hypothetical protein
MKKNIFSTFICLLFILLQSKAQQIITPQIYFGYSKSLSLGASYTNYGISEPDYSLTYSGFALQVRANYSLIGRNFFAKNNARFYAGDYLGVGIGVGNFAKDKVSATTIPITLELGAALSYQFSNDWDGGLKCIFWGTNYFTNFNYDFALTQTLSFTPSVRYKRFVGALGFGQASLGSFIDSAKGLFVHVEARYLFSEPRLKNTQSIFFRLENFNGSYTRPETFNKSNQNGFQIMIGLSFM